MFFLNNDSLNEFKEHFYRGTQMQGYNPPVVTRSDDLFGHDIFINICRDGELGTYLTCVFSAILNDPDKSSKNLGTIKYNNGKFLDIIFEDFTVDSIIANSIKVTYSSYKAVPKLTVEELEEIYPEGTIVKDSYVVNNLQKYGDPVRLFADHTAGNVYVSYRDKTEKKEDVKESKSETFTFKNLMERLGWNVKE